MIPGVSDVEPVALPIAALGLSKAGQLGRAILVTSGAGGVLLLMPNQDAIQRLSDDVKDSINALHEHLHTTEFEIPIYFAQESGEHLEQIALVNNIPFKNQGFRTSF